ncbi:MAG: response regulator [Candidatus Tantalella remota]|nr:response regulator [Candidatus Tantalella remota]
MFRRKSAVTVLVVDDDEDTLLVYDRMLSREGYRVIKARNGKESLEVAAKDLPDVIIMDIMMPKADGISSILKLKTNEGTRGIPVIVSTSVEEADDRVTAENLGVAGYVVKKADMQSLISKIEEVLNNERK